MFIIFLTNLRNKDSYINKYHVLGHRHFHTHVHVLHHAMEKILPHALSQNRQGMHVSIVDIANAKLKFTIDEDGFSQPNKKKIEILIYHCYMIYDYFMLICFIKTIKIHPKY